MAPSSLRLIVSTAVAVLALVACGGPGPQPGGQAGAGTNAETHNGEAKAVTYADSRFHYRIDGPGQMTVASDGSAAYVGSVERLEVKVVTGPAAADPAGLARSDQAALSSSLTGFRLITPPSSLQLNSRKAIKLTYTWEAGSNAVTGKPLQIHSARYYIPKDAATVAVVTYGAISSQFDPQGADDVALTFQWQ